MNCLIFPTPPPFKLAPDSPKLEHVEKVLKAADGGTVFAGQANGGLFVCKFEKLADGGATLTPEAEAILAAYERYCANVRQYAAQLFEEDFREFLR